MPLLDKGLSVEACTWAFGTDLILRDSNGTILNSKLY